MSKTTRIVIGWPWYSGPDIDCYPAFFDMMTYYGKLRERSLWFEALKKEYGSVPESILKDLPKLDSEGTDGQAEITPEDGVFEIAIANQSRVSLPGLARENLVHDALAWNADYLFMWDSDMLFPLYTLLRLLRHNKPVVNALGFTSRPPISPCIYKIVDTADPMHGGLVYDQAVLYDYPKNSLVGSEDIGGGIAFGAGISLIHMNVFRQISRPWFNSTGCGEDWFFCVRCHLHGISRYVDTSIPVFHKAHQVSWHGEALYDQTRLTNPELYKAKVIT